ncbi:MAG: hypothetical protein ACLP9L_00530 [Thermoguttaceae bacterium]
MASVYLETMIPSYLTAWRSPELVMAARQQITRDWWDNRLHDFELFVSQLVIDEGDMDMKLDPVLAEIRAVREAYAEKFAGDIKGMLADICRRQQQGGRKTVSRLPRTIDVIQKGAVPNNQPASRST